MEELKKLNQHFEDMFSQSGDLFKETAEKYVNEPETLWMMAQKVEKEMDQLDYDFEELPNLTAQDIFKIFWESKKIKNSWQGIDQFIENVINYIKNKHSLTQEASEDFRKILNKILSEQVKQISSFPTSALRKIDTEFWNYAPEIKSYFELLLTLRDQFDLSWNDVFYSTNIMMGADDNLKIIDLGIWN